EREAKKLVLVNKDNGVETYRCSNGFTFKVKVMKRK
ncbi:MAG: XRE family transcriptional regulator, partial [Bacilli bacterium]|nr:XRE family transcriptional regulator [Bacilli bacterium]